jgi:hypothetical protein
MSHLAIYHIQAVVPLHGHPTSNSLKLAFVPGKKSKKHAGGMFFCVIIAADLPFPPIDSGHINGLKRLGNAEFISKIRDGHRAILHHMIIVYDDVSAVCDFGIKVYQAVHRRRVHIPIQPGNGNFID